MLIKLLAKIRRDHLNRAVFISMPKALCSRSYQSILCTDCASRICYPCQYLSSLSFPVAPAPIPFPAQGNQPTHAPHPISLPSLHIYRVYEATASGFLLASYPCFIFISSTRAMYFFSASAGVTPSLTIFSQALYLYFPWIIRRPC